MHFPGRLVVFALLFFGSLWAMKDGEDIPVLTVDGGEATMAEAASSSCADVLSREALIDALFSPGYRSDICARLMPCCRAVYGGRFGEFFAEAFNVADEFDDRGITPLHIAMLRGSAESIECLVRHGALKKIYYRLYVSIKIVMAALGYVEKIYPFAMSATQEQRAVLSGAALAICNDFVSDPATVTLAGYREWCYKVSAFLDQCIKLTQRVNETVSKDETFLGRQFFLSQEIRPAVFLTDILHGPVKGKDLLLELPVYLEGLLPSTIGSEYSDKFFALTSDDYFAARKISSLFGIIKQWLEGEIVIFMQA